MCFGCTVKVVEAEEREKSLTQIANTVDCSTRISLVDATPTSRRNQAGVVEAGECEKSLILTADTNQLTSLVDATPTSRTNQAGIAERVVEAREREKSLILIQTADTVDYPTNQQISLVEAIPASRSNQNSRRILVLDLDNTLYRNDWAMSHLFAKNMNAYCTEKLELPDRKSEELHEKYGSTLVGLLQEGLLKETDVSDFLETCHTFPNEGRDLIQPDKKLRSFLLKVTVPMFVFTAGIRSHVERCCRALGVSDLIIPDDRPIIDIYLCNLRSKYLPESLQICIREMSTFLKMKLEPKDLVFVDDTLKNLQCAKKNGWGTCVLVGARSKGGGLRTTEMEGVDFVIEHVSELESIDGLQDLFS